ncbi:acyl carrier protein [Lentzea sp. CC55]|uniref:acyl carrier protein n=1 Tax=Lentzea sp. CC55 TaxID=2884909 RepID=UPI001F2344AD|nr:acyl carrier protein [Lentzea sp. CC55]MCG8928245.1 acyl carrier protein [Lentzea sp. CC55]
MPTLHGTIAAILTTRFAVPADAITEDTVLEEVLTDSLDVVEFGVVIGERYNTVLSDEEIAAVVTIADVAALMSRKVAA